VIWIQTWVEIFVCMKCEEIEDTLSSIFSSVMFFPLATTWRRMSE
jgi:hypothetical protein